MARPKRKKEAPAKKKVKRKVGAQVKPQVRRRAAPPQKPVPKASPTAKAKTPRKGPTTARQVPPAPPSAPRAPAKGAKGKASARPRTAPARPKKPATGIVGWVTKFIQKPTTTPKQRAAAKKSLERAPAPSPAPAATPPKKSKKATEKAPTKKAPTKKVVRDKRGRVRDYKKEYQRRIARGEVLQRPITEQPSKAVSRGHPRRAKGEIGIGELRQLRRAVELPSPGEQRRSGVKVPVQYEERVNARAFIAEIAGISAKYVAPSRQTMRSADAARFAEIFIALGLGSLSDAYTLYFSP